jgi:hypothetical protein
MVYFGVAGANRIVDAVNAGLVGGHRKPVQRDIAVGNERAHDIDAVLGQVDEKLLVGVGHGAGRLQVVVQLVQDLDLQLAFDRGCGQMRDQDVDALERRRAVVHGNGGVRGLLALETDDLGVHHAVVVRT